MQAIKLPHTLPMILQWDESFDIGSDTLTGVNDADYQPPFPLTAKLNKLTIKLDRPQLSPRTSRNSSLLRLRRLMARRCVTCSLGRNSGWLAGSASRYKLTSYAEEKQNRKEIEI